MLRISYEFGVLVVEGAPVTREGHILEAEAIRDREPAQARREMELMLENNRKTAAEYWAGNPSGDG